MSQLNNTSGQKSDPKTTQLWIVRYFMPASLLCIVFASVLFGVIFKYIALENLISLSGFNNTTQAKMMSDDIWKRHHTYFLKTESVPDQQWLGLDSYHILDADIRRLITDTQIINVKLLNLKGRILYSAEKKQVGKVGQESKAVSDALKGVSFTGLYLRERIQANNKVKSERNILSGYYPVYVQVNEKRNIAGVIEMHSDVTDFYEQIIWYRNLIILIAITTLTALFMLMMFYVRKTERSVNHQRQADREENEERVRHVAYHDGLTGLPNRELFCYRLTSAIAQAKRTESLLSILSIDLDRFKQINDGYGHDVGDQLLKEVSLRLADCVRVSDTVARQGGDDFTILLEGINHVDEVTQVVDRIIGSVSQPAVINGNEVYTSVSIGITVYPFDDVEAEHLLKDAETAMQAAKSNGRNNYQFFSENMHRANAGQLDLEKKLRKALSEDEYLLQFQPVVDVSAGKMIGVEALLRWNNSEYGIVSPVKFIPILEESGVMSIVGEWVMKTACKKVKSWHDAGYEKISMAVNISVVQFRQRNFVETVKLALEESNLDPKYLKLELTESMLMDQSDVAIQKLNSVREIGVHIEADDFGTGYSSLSYLKKLPIDVLKIDRSFVTDVDKSSDSAAIVTAISALAHSLKLMVIAEGVETMGELKFLSALNCHLIQGFLLSKPLPEAELVNILESPQHFQNLLMDIKERQAS